VRDKVLHLYKIPILGLLPFNMFIKDVTLLIILIGYLLFADDLKYFVVLIMLMTVNFCSLLLILWKICV
jgi:hypothetical protein